MDSFGLITKTVIFQKKKNKIKQAVNYNLRFFNIII